MIIIMGNKRVVVGWEWIEMLEVANSLSHVRVADLLQINIDEGLWHNWLPTQLSELITVYAVSGATVQLTLNLLTHQGFVVAKPG